jgi:hypothetical protein
VYKVALVEPVQLTDQYDISNTVDNICSFRLAGAATNDVSYYSVSWVCSLKRSSTKLAAHFPTFLFLSLFYDITFIYLHRKEIFSFHKLGKSGFSTVEFAQPVLFILVSMEIQAFEERAQFLWMNHHWIPGIYLETNM